MPKQLMLDTHVLLWMLTDPARLSAKVRDAVVDRNTELFVSAASAWEIATKQRLGKLPQADVLTRAYRQHLTRLAVQSIPISDEHRWSGSQSFPESGRPKVSSTNLINLPG